jgi:hypothetical protein
MAEFLGEILDVEEGGFRRGDEEWRADGPPEGCEEGCPLDFIC